MTPEQSKTPQPDSHKAASFENSLRLLIEAQLAPILNTVPPTIQGPVGTYYQNNLELVVGRVQKELEGLRSGVREAISTHEQHAIELMLKDGSLSALFREQSDLAGVLRVGIRAMHVLLSQAAPYEVCVLLNDDFRSTMNGDPAATGPRFVARYLGFSESNAQKDFKDLDTRFGLLGKELSPIFSTFRDPGQYKAHTLLADNMRTASQFQWLQGKVALALPVRYGDAKLAVILAIIDREDGLPSAVMQQSLIVSHAMAEGIAHIKRMEDAESGGSRLGQKDDQNERDSQEDGPS